MLADPITAMAIGVLSLGEQLAGNPLRIALGLLGIAVTVAGVACCPPAPRGPAPPRRGRSGPPRRPAPRADPPSSTAARRPGAEPGRALTPDRPVCHVGPVH